MTMPNWGKVEGALIGAKGIAFDGCHKIYVLLDEAQMAQMKCERQASSLAVRSMPKHGQLAPANGSEPDLRDLRHLRPYSLLSAAERLSDMYRTIPPGNFARPA